MAGSQIKHIFGIDFGMAYTYIVYRTEKIVNGKKVMSKIKSLTSVLGGTDNVGIPSYILTNNDESKVLVGKEAEKMSDVRERKKVKEYLNECVEQESDIGHYESFPEFSSNRIFKEDSHPLTSQYFKLLFFEIIKSNQELASAARDVEFIIGTPPGCGKAYADELKHCVKRGYRDAIIKYLESALSEEEKRSGKKITAEEIGLTVKSSCYPEPLLAGYAWLYQDNQKGLKEGDTCFVVDIGAGTADYAFIEKRGGELFAKKTDDNGKVIECDGTKLGDHAGDKINKCLKEDLKKFLDDNSVTGNITERDACVTKEKTHGLKASSSHACEIKPYYRKGKNGEDQPLPITKNGELIADDEQHIWVSAGNDVSNQSNGDLHISFEEILTTSNYSALKSEFEELSRLITDNFKRYSISSCKKILFVGGSSYLDELKTRVVRKISFVTGIELERIELKDLALLQSENFDGFQLNHASAVAIGACLSHSKQEMVTTPSLRIYIEDIDDDEDNPRTEVHSLINTEGYCTGPVVITKSEIEQDIGAEMYFYFREGGDLVYLDTNEPVLTDKIPSAFELRDPDSDEEENQGVDFVTIDGRRVKDTGTRWPSGNQKAKISVYEKYNANLIIFASNHGKDMNRSFVYILQKLEPDFNKHRSMAQKRMKNGLQVYNVLKKEPFDFKIHDNSANGKGLTLDEKAFNEKAAFFEKPPTNTYYFHAMQIGTDNFGTLDSILANPDEIKGTDLYQYIKIFNGNWNDEN